MKTATPNTVQWSAWIRWGILTVFVLSALVTTMVGMSSGAGSQDVSTVASGTHIVLAASDTVTPTMSDPALASYVGNRGESLDFLPAYRWSNTELQSSFGIEDGFKAIMSGFAGIMFVVASLIWAILLRFLYWAVTIDPITAMTSNINLMFVSITDALWTSGIVAVVLILVLVAIVRSIMKGNLTGTFGMAMACLIPLAAIQMLSTAAAQTPEGAAPSAAPPNMSPAWIAQKGSETATTAGSTLILGLANSVGAVSGDLSSKRDAGGSVVNCTDYTNALYSTYRSLENVKDGKIKDTSTVSMGAIQVVSQMWELSYLNSWQMAQFGDNTNADKSSCHLLELLNRKSTPEQYAIVGGSVAVGGDDTQPSSGPFKNMSSKPFSVPLGAPKDSNEMTPYVFAWAACANNYGKEMTAGWGSMAKPQNPAAANVDDRNAACSAWSGEQNKDNVRGLQQDGKAGAILMGKNNKNGGLFIFDNLKNMEDGTSPGTDEAKGVSAEELEALSEVQSTYRAYWGHNGGQRMLAGLVALLGALIYGYVMIGLALGAIIAQLAFAIMMALLPLSLFLAAFARKHPGANPGLRMLKVTFALGLAKIVLLMVITILMILTVLIAGFSTDDSIFGSFLVLAAPLVAWIMLKFGAQKMGFGDIMSMGGATGLSTTGALRAAGEKEAAASITGRMSGRGALGAMAAGQRLANKLGAQGKNADRKDKKKDLKTETDRDNARKGLKANLLARKQAAIAGAKASIGGSRAVKGMQQVGEGMKEKMRHLTPPRVQQALDGVRKGEPVDMTRELSALPSGDADPSAFKASLAAGTQIGAGGATSLLSNLKANEGIDVDGNLRSLSSEAVHANAIELATKLGIPSADVLNSQLPLAALVTGVGAVAGTTAIIRRDDGTADVEKTLAAIPITSMMSPEHLAKIAELSASLATSHPELDQATLTHVSTHVVGQELGLITSDGQVIRAESVVDINTESITRAIADRLALGETTIKIPEVAGIASMTGAFTDFESSVKQAAKNILSNSALNQDSANVDALLAGALTRSAIAASSSAAAKGHGVTGDSVVDMSSMVDAMNSLKEALESTKSSLAQSIVTAASCDVTHDPSQGPAIAAYYEQETVNNTIELERIADAVNELSSVVASGNQINSDELREGFHKIDVLAGKLDDLRGSASAEAQKSHRAAAAAAELGETLRKSGVRGDERSGDMYV